jgi:hypothetical protein
MPVVEITLPEGRFEQAEQEALAAELTRLIIHWAAAADRPRYDAQSWAFVQQSDLAEACGRPRRPDRGHVYRVVVSVPKGSRDAARRSGLMHDLAQAVIAAEGSEPTIENLRRVRCVAVEISDGDWDIGPWPLRLRDLAALFGVGPDDQGPDQPCGQENHRAHLRGRAHVRVASAGVRAQPTWLTSPR